MDTDVFWISIMGIKGITGLFGPGGLKYLKGKVGKLDVTCFFISALCQDGVLRWSNVAFVQSWLLTINKVYIRHHL